MKRVTMILAFIGMIGLQSCTVNEDNDNIDNDTVAEVFELRNINFGYDNVNGYNIYQSLNPILAPGDVMLIYRLSGTINSSTPIWQQIPRTLYLPEGELDYDFDFSRVDFTIYAGGTYDLALTPTYITNETFRLVIIPANFGGKISSEVNYEDYHSVIRAFNIDDKNVKVL